VALSTCLLCIVSFVVSLCFVLCSSTVYVIIPASGDQRINNEAYIIIIIIIIIIIGARGGAVG
jgi:hypothetical protein